MREGDTLVVAVFAFLRVEVEYCYYLVFAGFFADLCEEPVAEVCKDVFSFEGYVCCVVEVAFAFVSLYFLEDRGEGYEVVLEGF